jgi:hypothetical protein
MGTATPLVTAVTVIKDVAIVNTRDGSLAKGMDVLVKNGRIGKIGKTGSIPSPGAAHTMSAGGKYLVPGFLDMHAHAMYSHALSAIDQQQNFNLMIANGITGFREMSGSKELIAQARLLRQEIEAGTAVAPEPLIIPGDVLNIFPGQMLPIFEGSGEAGADPAEMARIEVTRQKEYGAEFIKIANANREAFFAIQDTAGRLGLHVAGHLNPVVSATEASNAGLKAIEHLGPLLGILLDCSIAEKMIRRKMTAPGPALFAGPPSLEMIRRIVANPMMLAWSRKGAAAGLQFAIKTFSKKKGRVLSKVFVRNGTWQVPTLIRVRTMEIFNDPVYRNDPNLRYVAPETRAMWQELADEYEQKASGAVKRAFRSLYDLQLELVKLFKEEGVHMLAGSDMTGGWCIPGFSLQQEFRELSNAGLSPLEILQMTTLKGAEFLGREATMGTVEEGKKGDLVVLDANPIESAGNLGKIHAVVLRGRCLPKAELERMKNDVESFYACDMR